MPHWGGGGDPMPFGIGHLQQEGGRLCFLHCSYSSQSNNILVDRFINPPWLPMGDLEGWPAPG